MGQFGEYAQSADILEINPEILENFFADLHQKNTSKTVKRKITSLKAFFSCCYRFTYYIAYFRSMSFGSRCQYPLF
ncbi:MAG: hypothetical protein NC489_39370 [Ruminococcus flavefaciens]|nr:hypothetical protein [Ruminococcus flavefaciens]